MATRHAKTTVRNGESGFAVLHDRRPWTGLIRTFGLGTSFRQLLSTHRVACESNPQEQFSVAVLSGHDTEERVRLRPRDESMSQTVTWRLAYVIRAFPLLGKLTYSVAGRLVPPVRSCFSRIDLQPNRQCIYDEQGRLLTDARCANYKEYDGVSFSSRLEIVRSQEECDITLNVLKLEINKPLRDEQFALVRPPGSR